MVQDGRDSNGDASVYDRPSRSRSDHQIGLTTVIFCLRLNVKVMMNLIASSLRRCSFFMTCRILTLKALPHNYVSQPTQSSQASFIILY